LDFLGRWAKRTIKENAVRNDVTAGYGHMYAEQDITHPTANKMYSISYDRQIFRFGPRTRIIYRHFKQRAMAQWK